MKRHIFNKRKTWIRRVDLDLKKKYIVLQNLNHCLSYEYHELNKKIEKSPNKIFIGVSIFRHNKKNIFFILILN